MKCHEPRCGEPKHQCDVAESSECLEPGGHSFLTLVQLGWLTKPHDVNSISDTSSTDHNGSALITIVYPLSKHIRPLTSSKSMCKNSCRSSNALNSRTICIICRQNIIQMLASNTIRYHLPKSPHLVGHNNLYNPIDLNSLISIAPCRCLSIR